MKNILEQFARLDQAVIDASSVIYLEKAGCLSALAGTIVLKTVPGVFKETGILTEDIGTVDMGEAGNDLTTDQKVGRCAENLGCPVISEDRAILHKARRQGMEYFNALVMLHFLLFRGVLDEDWHRIACERLLMVARYSPEVLRIGNEIYNLVKSARG